MPITRSFPWVNSPDLQVKNTYWSQFGSRRSIFSYTMPGTRTGQKGENWRQRIKSGLSAGTPFVSDRYRVVQEIPQELILRFSHISSPTVLPNSDSVYGIQIPISPFGHLGVDSDAVEAAALKKLYARIKSERTHFKGMQFLGELRETLHGIRHPTEALIRFADSFITGLQKKKNGVLKLPPHQRASAWTKALAGSVLEWNFGWAPLISDVKEFAEALGRFQEPRPTRTRISASASLESASTWSTPNVSSAFTYSAARLLEEGQLKTKRTVTYRTGFVENAFAASGSIDRIQDLFGLSIGDFVPTLWEILPWSWLADYFSNLGDLIDAASTNVAGLSYVVRTEVISTEKTVQGLLDVGNSQNYYGGLVLRGFSGAAGRQTIVRNTVTRSIPASIPMPPLVIETPLDNAKKLLNMWAVLEQRRKGIEDLSSIPKFGRPR